MHFRTFEELTTYLRQFTTWGNRGGYDFGGALQLFEACLENLKEHTVDGDIAELEDRLRPDTVLFLKQLARMGSAGSSGVDAHG